MFIRARVSETILNKADKFFTGTVDGRIIELVQNARRAGATRINITHEQVLDKAFIVFEDNGFGISDFAKLLDLGASGWNRETEDSECPAGIGLFSLAPRCVQIQSMGKSVTIEGDGWIGAEVEVRDDPTMPKGAGTRVTFQDEPWVITTEYASDKGKPVKELREHAAYSGVEIVFNGQPLPKRSFMLNGAVVDAVLPELGIHVQVYDAENLRSGNPRCDNCYNKGLSFNFFGQILSVDCSDVDQCGGYHFRHYRHGHFLSYPPFCMHIEMTGGPSPLRLMLPARTKFVKDAAYKKMVVELERLMYTYISKHPHHDLTFAKWQRAKALGIELPEASPVFQVGTAVSERGNHTPEDEPDTYKSLASSAVEADTSYKVWIDDECVYDNEEERSNSDLEEGILHSILLAEPQTDDNDGVPESLCVISIPGAFHGYSWTSKPGKLVSVEIRATKELNSEDTGYATVRVFETLTAEVHASLIVDGEERDVKYTTNIPCCWLDSDSRIAVAKEALGSDRGMRRRGYYSLDDLFWLAGGYDEDNSDWDKQQDDFWEAIQRLRDEFINEFETMRRTLIDKVHEVTGRYYYDKVTVDLLTETVEAVHHVYPRREDRDDKELIVVRKDGTFTKTPL